MQDIYVLVKYVNFSAEYVERLSSNDRKMFIYYYEKEEEEKRKAEQKAKGYIDDPIMDEL